MNDRTLLAPLRSIARGAFPGVRYLGIYEYVVNSSNGTDYELVPTDPTAKVPPTHAKLRPGIPGLSQVMPKGALVLLQFINGDSTRPCIVSVAGPDDAGFTPVSLGLDCSGAMTLGASSSAVHIGKEGPHASGLESGMFLRVGDMIMMPSGSLATPTPTTVQFAPGSTTSTVQK